MVVTSYGRNKNIDDEIKKHSRTSPDVQLKEFSWTKQKTRPRTDYELTRKNKSDKNLKKNNINVKLPRVNKKPLARNANLVQTKN